MSRKTPEQKVDELRQKKLQLDAQVKLLEGRIRQRKRKEDTRRKILIGSAVFAKMEKDPSFKMQIETLLNESLSRKDDRELFNLKLLPDEK